MINETEISRSVSVRCDRNYVRALKNLADDRGLKTADLVREALDKAFGSDIERYKTSLAAAAHNSVQPN
jgi:predicted DNA-binding protein